MLLGGRDIEIRHVEVKNYTANLAERAPFDTFSPCAVLEISMGAVRVRRPSDRGAGG